MNQLVVVISSLIILAFQAFGAVPSDQLERDLFNDFAGIVGKADEHTIRKDQDEVLRETGISIAVFTIDRMEDHFPDSPDIEDFARHWFNAWRVGGEKGDGILILVSSKDRKSRIELGPAWRSNSDELCERLIRTEMDPRFERGEYGVGLVKAVQEMAKLARGGPGKNPHERDVRKQIDAAIPQFAKPLIRVLLGAVGVGCLFLALRSGRRRRSWLTIGSIMLGLALLTGLMLPVLLLWVIFGPAIEIFDVSVGGGFWDRRSGSSSSDSGGSCSSGSSCGGGDSLPSG